MKIRTLFLFIALAVLATPAWAQNSLLNSFKREYSTQLAGYVSAVKSQRGLSDSEIESEVKNYLEQFLEQFKTAREVSNMKAAMAGDANTPPAVKTFFSGMADFALRANTPPAVAVKVLRQLGDGCVSVNFLKTEPYDRVLRTWRTTFELHNNCPAGQLQLAEVLDNDMTGDPTHLAGLSRGFWIGTNHPPQLIESYPTDRKRAVHPTKEELGYVAIGQDASPEKGSFTIPGQGIMERKVIHSGAGVLQVVMASCRTWRLPIDPYAAYRDYMLEHWDCRPLFLLPGEEQGQPGRAVVPPSNNCSGPISPALFRYLLSNVKEERFRELVRQCGLGFRIDQTLAKQLDQLGLTPGTFTTLASAKVPAVGAPPSTPAPITRPIISPIPSVISENVRVQQVAAKPGETRGAAPPPPAPQSTAGTPLARRAQASLPNLRKACATQFDAYTSVVKRQRGLTDSAIETELAEYLRQFMLKLGPPKNIADLKAAIAADTQTPAAVKSFFSCMADFGREAIPSPPFKEPSSIRRLGDGCVYLRLDSVGPADLDNLVWESSYELRNSCPYPALVEMLDNDMKGSPLSRGAWVPRNFRQEPGEASSNKDSFTIAANGIMDRKIRSNSDQAFLEYAIASCRAGSSSLEPVAAYRSEKLERWECRPLSLLPGETPSSGTTVSAQPANNCTGAMSISTFRILLINNSEDKFRELLQKCGLAFRPDDAMTKYLTSLTLKPATSTAIAAARMPAAPRPAPAPVPVQVTQTPPAPAPTPAPAPAPDSGLAEITFWNSIKDDKTPEGFSLYLGRYPQGQFADLAKLRVQQFTKPAAPPTPPPAPVVVAPVAPPAPPAPSPAPFLARIDEQLQINDANAAEGVLAELVNAIPGADVREARSKIESLRRRIDEGRTRTAGTLSSHPLDQLPYVWIPAGTFQMGCSTADRDCSANENPAHLVRLTSGFWLGQTEVTTEAYAKFVAATGGPRARGGRQTPAASKAPMDNLTWPEAQDYCKWIGGSLPTEAQWEYAARAGAPTSRYGELRDIAWFKDNSGSRVRDAGQKKSNAWGAQDMLGNLWEWVGDWYAPDYYRPATVSDPTGPASGTQRVVRGGSWDNAAGLLRVSLRFGNDPGARSPNNGFRCALKAMP